MLVETSYAGGAAALDLIPESKLASEFERIKGEFLASLDHELRTPLSGVIGMADLLLETVLTPDQKEYVSSARRCAEHLLETLNTTLEYSAIVAGPVLLDNYEFNLPEIIHTAVAAHAPKAQAKSVRVRVKLERDLPHAAVGDARRVGQVVSQLVANAIKFTDKGEVTVRAGVEGDSVLRIAVADTGIGMDPGQLVRMFESFQQAKVGLQRSHMGLGLGLALVLKIVSAFGGSIDVDGWPGKGCAFTVRIPLTFPRPIEQSAKPGRARAIEMHRRGTKDPLVSSMLK